MNMKGLYRTINSNIKVFTRSKEKVFQKFLIDAIFGILGSKSVRLSDLSKILEEQLNTNTRHIFKRLDRAIGKYDTYDVKNRVQGMQSAMVDENTLLYFDPTEVIKKYGKKFEAMSNVADGSDSRKLKNGYPVNVCIGVKGEEIIPLELNLYSYKEEGFISENDEVLQPIDGIAHRARMKGTFVLDRGFDRFAIIRHLMYLDVNFIIRMQETRHYYPVGYRLQSFTRHELIKRFTDKSVRAYLDIRVDKKLKKKCFSIKASRVELKSGKISGPRTMWLVQARASKLMTLYFLTNIQDITRETLISIVQAYLNRWKVEEFIRFFKQQYKAEKFLVRDLGRIKNLFNLLFIALVTLTRISELNMRFSRVRSLLIKHAKRTFKIPQKMKFFLYTIADGLAQVLKIITKKVQRLIYRKPKNQLHFTFEVGK